MFKRLIGVSFLTLSFVASATADVASSAPKVSKPAPINPIPSDPSKRVSSYPFVSGDTFRAFCDHKVLDGTTVPFDPEMVKDGDTIFINPWKMPEFFTYWHPKIAGKYILVTHNHTISVPGKYAYYLDDPKLIAWFGKNVDGTQHPKLFPIPLGLANGYWPHGSVEVVRQVMDSAPLLKNRPGGNASVYLNFDIATNKAEREHVWQMFKDNPLCLVSGPTPFEHYLRTMAQCRFTISPLGRGTDCHRTWEALLVGTIPIVPHSSIDPLFEGLPVILIHDWNEVTPEFLEQKYQEIIHNEYTREPLFADYWLNQIKAIQAPYRQ